MFYQCRLSRGDAHTVGWLEERGAKVGAFVQLLSADGEFWHVDEVYKPGLSAEALRQKQTNDRNSLPSLVGR